MRTGRGVVIGNIYDMDAARFQKLKQRRAARRDVYDANVGALLGEDETGLTVTHEVDPKITTAITKFGETTKSRAIWISGIAGILVGLLVGGMIWWASTQWKKTPARRKRKAKSSRSRR